MSSETKSIVAYDKTAFQRIRNAFFHVLLPVLNKIVSAITMVLQYVMKIRYKVKTCEYTHVGMTRSEIIRAFIKRRKYKSYLEIGINRPTQPGHNWENIKIDVKHGVDPNVDTTYRVTSDEFFAKHIKMKYDIIFVDGLHESGQAYRDIVNSVKWLNDGGVVVIHDCNPLKEEYTPPYQIPGVWTGDVWKAFLKLRMERSDLSMYTIDSDYGCGVAEKGSQKLFKPANKNDDIGSYAFFDKNRQEILNLISVREFKKRLKSN